MSLSTAITNIHERIAAAARRAARDPAEVTLIAVSKTHPAHLVAQALAAGVRHFGENRVQEAEEKITQLQAERAQLHWHLIGHLQRNKARRAAALFDAVHSLDSLRLAEALDRAAGDEAAKRLGDRQRKQLEADQAPNLSASPLPVLLQVNVSGEASKDGFDLPGGVENSSKLPLFLADVEQIIALPHLHVAGLMTIAPFGPDPAAARPTFKALRRLRDTLAQRFPHADWSQLSMGMTDDFEVAVEEGATMVRVGRAIFGER